MIRMVENMKRAITITFIVLLLLFSTACEDIGRSCDEHGVCTGIAEEDHDTLEPELVADISPDSQRSSEEST